MKKQQKKSPKIKGPFKSPFKFKKIKKDKRSWDCDSCGENDCPICNPSKKRKNYNIYEEDNDDY